MDSEYFLFGCSVNLIALQKCTLSRYLPEIKQISRQSNYWFYLDNPI